MDIDRPHRSNSSNNSGSSSNTTSELFICFTSRLSSSSSMKISSKSILSPGRSRESSQISLSNSLSRRLRSNGSMKGGQASPMFPTNSSNGKKRGCSFENPEPSSPKVTCIGQVRVKTKKQGRKMKMTGSRSQRRGGEVSFRRVDQTNSSNNTSNINLEVSNGAHQDISHTHQVNNQQECFPHRNQRWVHLPLTICEALRAFGAEFNCFLPCRSSCMASEKEKQEKAAAAGSNEGNSCGAVFARWLVAVQEGDDGKRREIELVVGEEEEEEREKDFSERRRSYRRHVFEEIEFTEEKYGAGNDDSVAQDEEAARVSICIPPKNALLLMRCRSDPVKMAALANKFWEAPVPNNDGENEVDDNIDVKEVKEVEEEEAEGEKGINNDVKVGGGGEVGKIEIGQELEQTEDLEKERLFSCQTHENEFTLEEEENDDEEDSKETRTDIEGVEEANLVQQEEETGLTQKTEINVNASSSHDETEDDPEKLKIQENEDNNNENINMLQENEDNQENRNGSDDDIEESSVHVSVHQELAVLEIEENQESKSVEEEQELAMQKSKEEERDTAGKACCIQEQNQETQEEEEERSESKTEEEEEEMGMESTKEVVESQQPLLPECLLLMMCEPKLSMEVSKETWVCSTDFIRWLPEPSRPHQVKKKDGGDQPKKRINNPPSVHGNLQPPRSSCSYPAKPPAHAAGAESMTTAIEKKLVGTKGYEPFVLTRCKSEPMRSASKLAPEACFWKNRKLEPHRPATLGVGAAGVGF